MLPSKPGTCIKKLLSLFNTFCQNFKDDSYACVNFFKTTNMIMFHSLLHRVKCCVFINLVSHEKNYSFYANGDVFNARILNKESLNLKRIFNWPHWTWAKLQSSYHIFVFFFFILQGSIRPISKAKKLTEKIIVINLHFNAQLLRSHNLITSGCVYALLRCCRSMNRT